MNLFSNPEEESLDADPNAQDNEAEEIEEIDCQKPQKEDQEVKYSVKYTKFHDFIVFLQCFNVK